MIKKHLTPYLLTCTAPPYPPRGGGKNRKKLRFSRLTFLEIPGFPFYFSTADNVDTARFLKK
ncbi:MAG: hypothetical protein GTN82_31385 [Candidatus Aminicenantes bacterium]|nr:hypothetical protein [Candidatus Aminicenantes bacterium]NIN22403.1 hypothetical protein [Candidatus Aminicenantes bacterium]NIN46171.1 hypothetical protein [Candidatus Aminicenantes bacterium]NIQ71384.1 hypothetical protein [Candidatus Aminicenantes bacterium]NIR09945.1 hypothetical protein [Candidatus Aminicenantes bacterium]